eukprot:10018674-Lingulodinium_polyedra.AAC.1
MKADVQVPEVPDVSSGDSQADKGEQGNVRTAAVADISMPPINDDMGHMGDEYSKNCAKCRQAL